MTHAPVKWHVFLKCTDTPEIVQTNLMASVICKTTPLPYQLPSLFVAAITINGALRTGKNVREKSRHSSRLLHDTTATRRDNRRGGAGGVGERCRACGGCCVAWQPLCMRHFG